MMKVTFKHALLALVVFIITLGVLKGAQKVYMSSVVRTPLIRTMERIPGVQRVAVGPNDTVSLVLAPHANLMASYQAVVADAAGSLGQTPSNIAIAQHPNRILSGLANQLQFVVAQGIATGQYVNMEQSILTMANHAHVLATVQLGTQHVYVTLSANGGIYRLYLVMPISRSAGGGVSHA